MHADIPNHMTVSEAINALRMIRGACRDINFRVITSNDIVDTCLGVDVTSMMSDADMQRALQLARDSYEMRHWEDMSDFDWDRVNDAIPDEFWVEMQKYKQDAP